MKSQSSPRMNLMEGMPPLPEQNIYFDNNATTAVAPEVISKMLPFLTEHYGNPSSMHSFGAQAGNAITEAREQICSLIGASTLNEIVLTGGGSESDNLAIVGTLHAYPEKKHIITTSVEHPAVLGLCRDLENRHGYDVTFLSVDARGRLDLCLDNTGFHFGFNLLTLGWLFRGQNFSYHSLNLSFGR